MLVNGKMLAEGLYESLARERKILPRTITLGMLVGLNSPVTESYVRIKERAAARLGVTLRREYISETASTAEAVELLHSLEKECDGVIPQLPMRKDIDLNELVNALDPQKDVDVLSEKARAAFARGEHIAPPVPRALEYILHHFNVVIERKKVVILGKGRLVGSPAATLFSQKGARVTSLSAGDHIETPIKDADIVILGAGSPRIITPEMVKKGVIILDAGTSELGGKVVGDASPSVAEKASLFTPVPGGVGPIAIAMIFRNLFDLLV